MLTVNSLSNFGKVVITDTATSTGAVGVNWINGSSFTCDTLTIESRAGFTINAVLGAKTLNITTSITNNGTLKLMNASANTITIQPQSSGSVLISSATTSRGTASR